MPFKRRRLSNVSILFLVVAWFAAVMAAPETFAKDPAKPDLSLKDMNGKRVHLRDYAGKIVIFNFWATWCRPCRDEMPRLVRAEKEYGSHGVVFVGASLDDDKAKEAVARFVREHEVDFPICGAPGRRKRSRHLGNCLGFIRKTFQPWPRRSIMSCPRYVRS